MRGSLSPSVLAKNKRIAVFRLVSERTDFSSEKSSCYRPTSEGICFAKQSEHWLTETTAQSGEVSGSVPQLQTYIVKKTILILQSFCIAYLLDKYS